jgi:hypothetical protein
MQTVYRHVIVPAIHDGAMIMDRVSKEEESIPANASEHGSSATSA